MNLSSYLKKRSKEICRDNQCKKGQHNCESYAYITEGGDLLNICISDYFQGSSQPYVAIPLPWNGTQEELDEEISGRLQEEW